MIGPLRLSDIETMNWSLDDRSFETFSQYTIERLWMDKRGAGVGCLLVKQKKDVAEGKVGKKILQDI